jgi:hypothetical protein
VPDVAGLAFDTLAGEAGDYMRRYYLQRGAQHLRFHEILSSDPGRHFHDHPWDYVSLILVGGYTEHTPEGSTHYSAPCLLVRQAEAAHRLELTAPAWTYVVTGPPRRRWGFHTEAGWIYWRAYAGAGAVRGGDEDASAW